MTINQEIQDIYSLATQHIVSKIITLASEIRLDELLNDDALLSVDEIAKYYNFEPKALYRYLRVLDAYNVVKLLPTHQVAKGHLCSFLEQIRGPHLLNGHKVLNNLSYSLQTNEECYSVTFGHSFYQHINSDPVLLEELKAWSEKSASSWLMPTIFCDFDFSGYKTICELNGDGYFLAYCLRSYSKLKGIYFSQAKITENIIEIFESLDVIDKVKLISDGDVSEISQVDLFVFCRSLLSLNDNQILKILGKLYSCRINSKLIIIDFFLPDKSHSDYQLSATADINLLCCLNGQLRTKDEWISLLIASGYKFSQFHHLAGKVQKPVLPTFLLEASS